MPPKTSRRSLLKAAGLTAAPAFAQLPKQPNILMVLTDDHSAPHLGCYGDQTIRTPRLDQFAAEGMRFDRAYTTAPQCGPSRASIMTGKSPQRVHMTRLAAPLPPEHETFFEVLRKFNYWTGVGGRWHHADGRSRPRPWVQSVYEKHDLQTMKNRVDFLGLGNQNDALAHLRAFLGQKPTAKPFAMQISFNDPHRRWDGNEFSASYKPEEIPVPRYLPDLPEVREDLTRYYGEVTRADGLFGRILDELDARGLSENTLVVFMGDNGHALPHGKGTLYQPGWLVPLLARWPGRIKPGSATAELVSGIDMPATFFAAAGVPRPDGLWESKNLLPLLEGRPFEGREHVFACRGWHDHLDLARAVCTRSHSLIYNCRPEEPVKPVDYGGKPIWEAMAREHRAGRLDPRFSNAYFSPRRPIYELYDLERDPNEFNNLAGRAEYRDSQFQLTAALDEWMEANYDFLPPPFVLGQEMDGSQL